MERRGRSENGWRSKSEGEKDDGRHCVYVGREVRNTGNGATIAFDYALEERLLQGTFSSRYTISLSSSYIQTEKEEGRRMRHEVEV